MRPRTLFHHPATTALCILLILSSTFNLRAQQCTDPTTITDANLDAPFMQNGRLVQNGVASSCAGRKAFPGVADMNPRRTKVYLFTNNMSTPVCVNVTLNAGSCTGASGLFSAAYTGFNPFDLTANYLADIGGSPTPSRSYSFVVEAGADFQVVVSQVNANQSCASYTLTVSGVGCLTPGEMLISEFRFGVNDGAQNSNQDEYVELYNNTDAPLTVSTADGSAGWALVADDGVMRFVIPNGTQIPARGHFLGVNSAGYSLGNYPAGNNSTATGDATYTRDIDYPAGIALFRTANPANFTLANRLDAVGFTFASSLYRENGLTGFPVSSSGTNYFHVRRMTSGLPQDTGNNATDFALVTLGFDSGATLGAPGPENLSSPIQRNQSIKSSLIDPTVPATSAPNHVRTTGRSRTASSAGSPSAANSATPRVQTSRGCASAS